jgi:hypothetical protein
MSIWVVALLIVIAMRAVAFFFPQMWATQIIGAVAIGFALIGFIENEVRGMKHFPLNPPEYYYGRKVAIISWPPELLCFCFGASFGRGFPGE